ncbi:MULTISPECIES: FAD-dependent oxidoreductase [unclassified Colwellia]|uniref:FAD-dependent oxidoreductase n=1 Tax=unclassified Colwellia TaxID=196834 RepID=UPI0015F4B57F|nr:MULTISPECIES: FAD-dependent oxidoreductase [unclassified Colwellia]MBA6230990.1 FAD-dependent monooxygenase [Colwellia sp. MB02u-7]MBA6234921.1 FAD-dependent monooxygenase [Colwellia sp. MB02u-11]MBA6255785.1 FAD-dependent monooxygenase [Colwellia sp. MB3u-28]MBA6261926.1 FAD-dependent monooxygenase [Colwellia sp. MB3u-41]MBA6301476.1 FAD-dependent monooxygenase [Colwellia sp. MB3u-22]
MNHFDCVVVGGGMVGAASALSLANLGLTVALVEQHQPYCFDKTQALDLRVSAISLASEHLLTQLGAWPQLQQWRLCPYKRLGVWEHQASYTEFNADDIEQSHLGHIIENRLVQLALWQQIKNHSQVTLFSPANLESFTQSTNEIAITLADNSAVTEQGKTQKITAKLLIAADGANSHVRKLANIGITGWDYQQSAMLINIETQTPQQDITWQQFFETGPLALLPLPGKSELGGYASLVWYQGKDEMKRLSSLSCEQLQVEILETFPQRLGKIKVIDKGAFPLTRRHANTYQKNRVLLLGDAAHTINPMAGQGVNLGFKDVKALQTVIASAIGNNECWHEPSVLSRYETKRRKDNLLMMSTMDSLYVAFSHPSPAVKIFRNIGLAMANKIPFLKKKALAYACGV